MIDIKLAVRSVIYRYKQYLSLFFICALGCGISLSVIAFSNGMLRSLRSKARIYYGGDLVLMRITESYMNFPDSEKYVASFKKYFPEDFKINERFDFDARNKASIIFEGEEVPLFIIKAIDFEKEQQLLKGFTFEGNKAIYENSNGTFISLPVANKLGLKVGDTFVLYLNTARGFVNTVPLKVNGIYNDSSVFGLYTLYMNVDLFKQEYQVSSKDNNRICVIYPEFKQESNKYIQNLHQELSKEYNMFPLVKDKQLFYNKMPFKKPTFALIPLEANLSDVTILEKAMKFMIQLITYILVLIVIIGVGSTFKVLITKRINEVGIFMALGMKKNLIIRTLMMESLFVMLCGSSVGLLFSLILSGVVHCFDFGNIPNLNIFLEAGRIVSVFDPTMTVGLILTIIVFTLTVVYFTVKKSVTILPVKALNTTK